MKSILLLFIFFTSIVTANVFGQTRYFKTPSGTIIDSTQYEKEKLASLEIYKKDMPPYIRMNEFFIEEYANKDSIVYSYRWTPYDPYMLRPASGTIRERYTGKELPDVALKTIDQTTFNINTLKGKPTLINFWFINCPPCVMEMPVLNKVQETLKDSVNFIAVTYNSRREVSNFLKGTPYNFMHIVDATSFINQLGVRSYPLTMFLDKEGKVVKMTNTVPFFINEKTKQPEPSGANRFIGILRSLL